MLIKRGKVWHSRIMHEGKFHWKSLRTGNRDTAVNRESLIRSELLRGEFGILDSKKTPTLAQFETDLLAYWKAHCKAPRTYGFYKQNLKVLTNCGFLALTKLNKIDEALIEKFIQRRLKDEVTPVTINHSLRTLRRILYIAAKGLTVKGRLIGKVPTITMLPDENQREYVLDDATVNKMVDWLRAKYPTSRFHLMLPFLIDTGLRITEACNLQREHIEFKNELPCSIRIVKGKSKYAKREIPLTERAALTLQGSLYASRCAYAFTSRGGRKPITRHYPSEQFRAVRDALGIGPECVLHSTRHTFCTRLGKGGADAFTIQKLAGHSSITISQRYVHPDLAAKQAAIALLDILNQPNLESRE